MELGNDTIKMFAPVHLVKGKDSSGKNVMRMEGIASTSSKDADGEFLDPNGFELDYFLKYGFMNWNHQTSKDPLALIGKPTEAVKKAEGLFVGCELFDNSPRAKEVYQLAEILEAQGGQLGFSIEGKVIERDAKNPKIVKKAKITGCAITPNPKNVDTVASIIKGHSFETLSAYDEEDEETREKALAAGSASGQALSLESLDGDVKHLDSNKKKKKLTKGEVMAQIFEDHPQLSLETGEELFNLISKIEKSIIMNKPDVNISPEAIEKAYATLGLKKGEESSEATSETGTETEGTDDGAEIEETELEKGYKELSKMMGSADYKKMSKEEKAGIRKQMSDTLKKMEDESDDDDDEDDDDEAEKGKGSVKKGITPEAISAATTILKAAGLKVVLEDDSVEKGESDEIGKGSKENIADLIKGEFDAIATENELKWNATTTLIKGFKEDIANLREEIDSIGGQSQGRKSVTQAASIEKSWDNDLEKGLTPEDNGMKKISKTRDKQVILNMLEETYFQKGDLVDPKLGNETAIFESSDQLSKGIIDTMKEKGYEIVG